MVVSETVSFSTQGDNDIINITNSVQEAVKKSKMQNGSVTVFVPGSTAGITTIEYESGAIADLKRLLDEIIPKSREYQHNLAWGDGNGYSHVRSAMIGPSLNVPFTNSVLLLGTWQQIVLIDCDNRPRSRSLILQILGE